MAEVLSGRSPWLWLGSGVVMIVALLFGIFADDDEFGGFGQFEGAAVSDLSDLESDSLEDALSDAIQDALSGNSGSSSGGSGSGNPFTSSDRGSEIVILDPAGSVEVVSVQDLLDGNGFEQKTLTLDAEGGRERSGVILEEILEQTLGGVWSRVRIVGAFGEGTEVDREVHDADPDQYLLYWSSDGDPSATVTITNPEDGVRVIDVTDIIVLE